MPARPDFQLVLLLPSCVTLGEKPFSLAFSFLTRQNMGILGILSLLGLLRPQMEKN